MVVCFTSSHFVNADGVIFGMEHCDELLGARGLKKAIPTSSPGAIPASMIPTPIPIPADLFDSDSDSDSSHLAYDSDSDSDSNTIFMNDSDSIPTRFRLQHCLYSYSDFRII